MFFQPSISDSAPCDAKSRLSSLHLCCLEPLGKALLHLRYRRDSESNVDNALAISHEAFSVWLTEFFDAPVELRHAGAEISRNVFSGV